MTIVEALQDIQKRCPPNELWYGIARTSTEKDWILSNYYRIKAGTATPETKRKFFAKFGYTYRVTETIDRNEH